MRITFVRDEIYETEGPGKGPKFPEGSTWDCAEDFGQRWVNRNAAEQVGDQLPKAGERYTRVGRAALAADEALATAAEPGAPAQPEQVSAPVGPVPAAAQPPAQPQRRR